MTDQFPTSIHEHLDYYVYRLIDPRDGSTFYVGKGRGNRVFAHLKAALEFYENEDAASAKIDTILAIEEAGHQPGHIIHRHKLTEEQALLVESTLIDAYPNLSNIVRGHGSNEHGPATAEELIIRYGAPIMEIQANHRIIAININQTFVPSRSDQPGTPEETSAIYNAVRCAWRVSLSRANKAHFVFAVVNGVCREVFEVTQAWIAATPENFPGLLSASIEGRHGFIGRVATDEVRNLYLKKRLPHSMHRTKGMASPILYNYP